MVKFKVTALLVCAAQLAYFQVVNEYINPFWVTGQYYIPREKLMGNRATQYNADQDRGRCQPHFYNKNIDNYDYLLHLIRNNVHQHGTNVNEQQTTVPQRKNIHTIPLYKYTA